MINSELLEKLNAMSAEVTKLETEAQRTIDNIDKQVMESRNEKELKIVEFLHSLEEVFKMGGFRQGDTRRYLCCGTHWEGKPHACGSHERSIGVMFHTESNGTSIYFGRYFLGTCSIDTILYVGTRRFTVSYTAASSYDRRLAEELRENIIDRWNEDVENKMSEWMVKIVQANLQKRIGTATEALKAANDKHDEYFKGE